MYVHAIIGESRFMALILKLFHWKVSHAWNIYLKKEHVWDMGYGNVDPPNCSRELQMFQMIPSCCGCRSWGSHPRYVAKSLDYIFQ